jgi:hypothetical protein
LLSLESKKTTPRFKFAADSADNPAWMDQASRARFAGYGDGSGAIASLAGCMEA